MSDEIKVGEVAKAVPWKGFAKVLSLHTASTGKQWAWIEWEDGYCASVGAFDLTRIELEKITLTPRFGIGEKVKIRFGEVVKINAVVVAYRDNENWLWAEDQLEPIPTPCPTCKGSGKSEGSA